MTVRFLDGAIGTVMFDSVTHWAFGPVFRDMRSARDFAAWCHEDPRDYSPKQLEKLLGLWHDQEPCPEHVCDDKCNDNPGICPIFKRMDGHPGFTS